MITLLSRDPIITIATEAGYGEAMSDQPMDRLRDNITEITSLVVTGVWLTALLTGQGWWLPALLVGYVVVVPVVAMVFDDKEDDHTDEDRGDAASADSRQHHDHEGSARDALETLRDRYARGELSEKQFERKLERLLDTETVEDAEEWVLDTKSQPGDEHKHRDPARETEVSAQS